MQLLGSLECYLWETYLTCYQCVVAFEKNASTVKKMVRGAVPPKLENLKKKNEVEKRIQTKGIQDEKKGEVCGLNLFIKSHYNVLITYFVFIIFPCLSCLNQFLSPPSSPACVWWPTDIQDACVVLPDDRSKKPSSVRVCNSISVSENKSYWFCSYFWIFFHQRKNCRSINWIHSHSHSQFKDSNIVSKERY